MGEFASKLCFIFIALEMAFVNFYNIHRICTPRHGALRRILHLSVWAIALTLGTLFIISNIKGAGNGNGLFVLSGILFFIPLRIEYKDLFSRIFEVACTACAYTFFVFAFSVQVSRMFPSEYFGILVLVTQSILHALLASWCAHYINNIFLETLDILPKNVNSKLRVTSALWLITFIVLNYAFLEVLPIIAIIGLICSGALAYLSYSLLHISLSSRLRVDKLKHIAYIDSLTNLPNRAAFFMDGQMFLSEKIPFDLVFLDLDHFKSINDTYGHIAGNQYLCGFASSISTLSNGIGKAYRMAGDEFVCLLRGGARQEFIVRLVNYKWPVYLSGQPFLGVAAGASRFPQDGTTLDELIHKADKAMYKQKNSGR
ncbi:MAG: GGDEF domain-containing protein [Oscillospiraceae bacterium]